MTKPDPSTLSLPELDEGVSKALGWEPRYAWHTGMGQWPTWSGATTMEERPEDTRAKHLGGLAPCNVFLVEVYRPVSSDPAHCAAMARDARRQGLGQVIVWRFKKGNHEAAIVFPDCGVIDQLDADRCGLDEISAERNLVFPMLVDTIYHGTTHEEAAARAVYAAALAKGMEADGE